MTDQLQPPHTEAAHRPAERSSPSYRRVASLVAALVIVLVAVASVWSTRPPQPLPASAPAAQFSASRAIALLDGIATVPRPAGSAAAAEVRTDLVGQLRRLGVDTTVQTRVTARPSGNGRPTVATVSNIHARIPGSDPTGRVLLVAHYDSVPDGPGASDNGANVAAILEIVRALRSMPQQRNDVDVLFTDAEEAGLLGANAFVESGAVGDPRRAVVVNLEARGVSGPAVMFQMVGGLTSAVADAHAVTTSFASTVYSLLPNDTDLTALSEGGMRGINFAFMEGVANYHTPHDDLAHVDAASVQHIGGTALAAVRSLAATDLGVDEPETPYFSLFGAVASYPAWLTLPLALVAVAAYILILLSGRRHGMRPRRTGLAAGSLAAVVLVSVGIGLGGWQVLSALRPGFSSGAGAVYHPEPYALAEALVVLLVLLAWYRWARRRASPSEVAMGVLGWFAVLAVVCAVLIPGGAYLFTWPALIGLGAMAAARSAGPESPFRGMATVAAAVPATALLVPVAVLMLPAVGLGLSAAPLLLTALLGATAVTLVEPAPQRRAFAALQACVLLAAAVTAGVGVAVDGFDADHPRPVSLAYAWEADSGDAHWVSDGGPDQPVVGPLLTAGAARFDDRIPPLGGSPLFSGPAPPAAGIEPVVTRSAPDDVDPVGGSRSIHLQIDVPADTYLVDVRADTTAQDVPTTTVNGVTIPADTGPPTGPWGWGFRYAAPPRDGIDLTLRVRGSGPLRIRVVSTTPGLPDDVGAPRLPPAVSWAGWPALSGQTIAVRTFTF